MALIARLDGVVVSGTAQAILAQDTGGAFVDRVTVKNVTGSNPITDIVVKRRPYEGGPQEQVAIIASLAASGISGVDVQRHLEWLDIEATQGSGGNTLDVAVTGGTES